MQVPATHVLICCRLFRSSSEHANRQLSFFNFFFFLLIIHILTWVLILFREPGLFSRIISFCVYFFRRQTRLHVSIFCVKRDCTVFRNSVPASKKVMRFHYKAQTVSRFL